MMKDYISNFEEIIMYSHFFFETLFLPCGKGMLCFVNRFDFPPQCRPFAIFLGIRMFCPLKFIIVKVILSSENLLKETDPELLLVKMKLRINSL